MLLAFLAKANITVSVLVSVDFKTIFCHQSGLTFVGLFFFFINIKIICVREMIFIFTALLYSLFSDNLFSRHKCVFSVYLYF